MFEIFYKEFLAIIKANGNLAPTYVVKHLTVKVEKMNSAR